MESYPLRTVAATGGILAVFCVFLQKYSDEAYVEPNDLTCIWFTLIAIIAGTQGIEELDTLSTYWHKNGGDDMMEFYNTWYAEVMAK